MPPAQDRLSIVRKTIATPVHAGLMAVLIVWLASLALPALQTAGGQSLDGFEMLVRGWTGFRSGVVSWYANPLLVIAVILAWRRRERSALAVSGLALLLALSSFAAGATARWAGVLVPDFGFRIGFYVWLTAHLGLVATCLSALTKHESAPNT